uniref:Uncharacterized protein n=1 Tax=Spongospora subterranea TaxID=70186 RepID=A0A0H5R9S4_9EUKA|eukprot:CRZ05179.1 hypothetical protein [Spongospora subterranea]
MRWILVNHGSPLTLIYSFCYLSRHLLMLTIGNICSPGKSDSSHKREDSSNMDHRQSTSSSSAINDHASDSELDATASMPSISGLFARELVHDLRSVVVQTRTGIDFSQHVAQFVKEVAGLQDQFANRLAKIIDREMVQFAVYDGVDGMHSIREIWLQTVEESRQWATSSKGMSISMMRLVDPLTRRQKSNLRKLDQIVLENDRLSRPLLEQQTSIARKQLRCSKAITPMLLPSYRELPSKKQAKIVGTARLQVVKYIEEVDRANKWIRDVTTISRPRMLEVLQKMEEDRIEKTRRVLLRYSAMMKDLGRTIDGVSNNVKNRLGQYRPEDDIDSFVDNMASRPVIDREYLAPFVYRLPVTLQELGIQHATTDHSPIKQGSIKESAINASSPYSSDDEEFF